MIFHKLRDIEILKLRKNEAAFIASMENSALSEIYHDDKLEEERVAEGVFSDVSAVASTAGASDQSFEVVDNESMHFADDKSMTPDLIPGYDRTSQISAAMSSLAPVGLKHFWEKDFWSSMFGGRGDTIHGAYNFNRPVNLMPLGASGHVRAIECEGCQETYRSSRLHGMCQITTDSVLARREGCSS